MPQELLKKTYNFEVKAAEDAATTRVLEFIGSTESVDRMGDIIEVAGWDLKNYKANPVFLWAHNYSMPPVGKALSVKKGDGQLSFKIEFADAETYAFADTIFKLYLGGFLKATSVGFQGLEREPIMKKDGEDQFMTGWRYKKQELFELSAVPVPANPEALQLGVQKGLLTQEMADALMKGEFPGVESLPDTPPEPPKAADPPEPPQADADPVPNEKAGAVLSTKNKTALTDAQALIQTVLDAAAKQDSMEATGQALDASGRELDLKHLFKVLEEMEETFTKSLTSVKHLKSLVVVTEKDGKSVYSLALDPAFEPFGRQPANAEASEALTGLRGLVSDLTMERAKREVKQLRIDLTS